jgi:hypothetical protein
MAAALIIALQILFGSSAATQPTSAQLTQANAYVAQQPGIIVVGDTIEGN